jgi:hypothetical protein
MSGTATIFAGTCRGVALAADRGADAVAQGVVERQPSRRRTNRTTRTSPHSWPITIALEHLVELLDGAVDLGGADAHAARVQRGVAAAEDHQAAALRELA